MDKLISYQKEVITNFTHNLFYKTPDNTDYQTLRINLSSKKIICENYVSESRIIFNKEDLATYEILKDGCINIHLHNDVNLDTSLYYALQIPLGCLYAQNGYLIAHASVAEKNGKCSAFFGSPGIGKSSLLMMLMNNGWNFVTEDICVIDTLNNYRCIPSQPYIKLSNDLAKINNIDLVTTNIQTDRLGRNVYQFDESAMSKGAKLESIFFLDWGSIINLYTPTESTYLRLLLNYLVPSFQSKANDMQIKTYKKVLGLINRVPSYVFERPKSLNKAAVDAVIYKINELN